MGREDDSNVTGDSEDDSPVRKRRRRNDCESRSRHRPRRSKRRRYRSRTKNRRPHDNCSEQHLPERMIQTSDHQNTTREELQRGVNSSIPSPTVSASAIPQGNLDSSTSIIVTAFKELIQTMNTDGSNERFPILNVIPEFDPAKRTQTIDTWIVKVNECDKIYNWTERQIIHYALPKLVGLAQKWYQGLPSLLFSWSEWQNKLKSAFPSDENYGLLLTEMLACRARFGESLEEYFYEKMILLNRCNIHGKNATDCILLGIEDRSVRTSAEAAQFTEPDKLLVYLRNVKSTKKSDKPNLPLRPGSSDNGRSKLFRSNPNSRDAKLPKCYNCEEDGHP